MSGGYFWGAYFKITNLWLAGLLRYKERWLCSPRSTVMRLFGTLHKNVVFLNPPLREYVSTRTSQKNVDSAVEKASTRGRPRKVSDRSVRKLIRTLKDMQSRNLNITVKNVIEKSGLSLEMASRRTFSRNLNEEGYSYLQARKKGLLSENDRKQRLRFARKMTRKVRENPDFWTNEVAFFLDTVSFVHKYNPQSGASGNRSRVWRRKGEGLKFTSKASKNLAGGRRLHVLVAIAYGKE